MLRGAKTAKQGLSAATRRGPLVPLDIEFGPPNLIRRRAPLNGLDAGVGGCPTRCSCPCCSSGECGYEDLRLLSPVAVDRRLRSHVRPHQQRSDGPTEPSDDRRQQERQRQAELHFPKHSEPRLRTTLQP